MGGINVLILRRDFTVARKKVNPKVSHVHFGGGSYLNMENGVLRTQNYKDPPILVFQEGNAIPKGVSSAPAEAENTAEDGKPQQAQNPLEAVKWGTLWYIPMLRGLNRQHHGKGDLSASFGKIFNLKTFPFWIIGLALLVHFLSGGQI